MNEEQPAKEPIVTKKQLWIVATACVILTILYTLGTQRASVYDIRIITVEGCQYIYLAPATIIHKQNCTNVHYLNFVKPGV